MQDLFTMDPGSLPMTLRTFREVAISRGWKSASVIRGKESYIFATRLDGRKMQFCSCAAPDTSYFSGILADDKYGACQVLKELGVDQPETILLSHDNYRSQLADLLSRHKQIVIKPTDGAHGNDVHVGIDSIDKASDVAAEIFTRHPGQVMAQEQVFAKGPEVRVICIGHKFINAFARIPAMVTGDGVHTVRELIDIENQTKRTAPYQSNLAFIDIASAEAYLAANGTAEMVPAADEKVQVVGACNTGKGGTMEDVTDAFPKELRDESEKIARGFNLPVIGIDYFGSYCLEVNSTPALYHPVDGHASVHAVEEWVKYLENLPLPS